jgi:CTP synthase (UTP-ammonia lyase)
LLCGITLIPAIWKSELHCYLSVYVGGMKLNLSSSDLLQCIEATDLELEMKHENPVRYHEAWQLLCSSNGIIIPGGFGIRGMEGKILAAEWARKTKKPFLGKI